MASTATVASTAKATESNDIRGDDDLIVAVATTSPIKLEALKAAFLRARNLCRATLVAVDVPSSSTRPEQPLSESETLEAAMMRIEDVIAKCQPDETNETNETNENHMRVSRYHYIVAIENGMRVSSRDEHKHEVCFSDICLCAIYDTHTQQIVTGISDIEVHVPSDIVLEFFHRRSAEPKLTMGKVYAEKHHCDHRNWMKEEGFDRTDQIIDAFSKAWNQVQ